MDVDPPPPSTQLSSLPTPLPTPLPPMSTLPHPHPEPPQTAVPPLQQPEPVNSASRDAVPVNTGAPASSLPRPSSAQPWPATALTPAPQTPAGPPPDVPASQDTTVPGTPGGTVPESGASSPSGSYRPLNVKDALTYLEMVKIKFQDRPDVYNQFLDIMKDFKSQSIDTPGVIERVSSLFNGHPTLIQGFNTFLPQGYRIDCSVEGEDNTNTITVTTPSGTHTQTSEGLIPRARPAGTPTVTPGTSHSGTAYFGPSSNNNLNPPGPSFGGAQAQTPLNPPFNDPVPPPATPLPPTLGGLPPPNPPRAFSPNHPIHSPHPTTPGVANLLGGLQHSAASSAASPQEQHLTLSQSHGSQGAAFQDAKRPVEFNHAINYVNKIKNRFASDPDTYKQFLEILQTYQRDQRPIQSVYEQVAQLFNGSVDLLDEFKQFLPDTSQLGPESAGSGGGLFGMIGHMTATTTTTSQDRGRPEKSKDRRAPPASTPSQGLIIPDRGMNGADKANPVLQKRKKRPTEKEPPPPPMPVPSGSRVPPHGSANGVVGSNRAKKPKHHHGKMEPSSPPYRPASPPHRDGLAQTTDDAAFFDRVKKYVDDRNVYNEFLKLLHLFTEEIIDIRTLVERAGSFLSDELMSMFKDILGWDERTIADGELGAPPTSNTRTSVSVVPTMDRPKVDLNSCRKYGPSYRKLPKHEATLACSGRDQMCWEVLNDEWVSHPTWASEDAGFSTHKKNVFEDAMHKSEEERHEYDFHIEALVKTIATLEPLNSRINHMDAEERASWKLKPGLGGQGKSIYQRIIKKVYGREHGLDVIQALHESPSIAIPVILSRLKQKEEEWKRAQREWNKVWREVDARNFYKSLDHQGINFKINDKKCINPKQLVQDIETKRREMDLERAKSIDPAYARTIPKYHYSFEISDVGVLQDCLKLVFSFLDRAPGNSAMAVDAKQIENFLKKFVISFFSLDDEEFSAPFANLTSGESSRHANGTEEMPESDGDETMATEEDSPAPPSSSSGRDKKKRSGDLRRKVLKGSASHKKGGSSAGGKKSNNSSRRASPAPAQQTAINESMQIDGDAETKTSAKVPAIRSHNLQDNIWIRHGQQDDIDVVMSSTKPVVQPRKGNFFANNTYYVLLRNLQLLYSRLHAAKQHAAELAAAPSPNTRGAYIPPSPSLGPGQLEPRPVPHAYLANPLAVSLGLADATGPGASRLIPSGPNPAAQFYEHTLECCEQLFDNEMDQNTFEDHLRFMYGIRAYHLFTVDKVVGSIIKQVQLVMADAKNKELFTLLRREREHPTAYTVQELINARRTAEHTIGPDENMYRITWLPEQKIVQMQLLAKNDASTDDAETIADRWRQYMDSYCLLHQTEGLPHPVVGPFMPRSRWQPESPKEDEGENEEGKDATQAPSSKQSRKTPEPSTITFRSGSHSDIRVRVSVRTYRLFFETGSEDLFFRKRTLAEEVVLTTKNHGRDAERKAHWKTWLDSKLKEAEDSKGSPVRDIEAESVTGEKSSEAKPAVEEPASETTQKPVEDVEMAIDA